MKKKSSIVVTLGLALLTAASGCGSSGADGASSEQAPSGERAVVEADIIKLDGGRLYTLSKAGSVSVVDVSTPGRLSLLGQRRLGGEPFEMYRRGDLLVTMLNGAFTADGAPVAPQKDDAVARYPEASEPGRGAGVVVIDAHNPGQLVPLVYFPVPGEIADSRMVGDVLYLATYENAQCWNCGTQQRTLVTSFDLKDPTAMRRVDQVVYASDAPNSYGLAWGISAWKRSIFVTPQRLYIGGHADIDPYRLNNNEVFAEGIIDVLDVSDPGGKLVRGAHLEVAGTLFSRWQMDERDGVLRVISQRGAGRTSNGYDMPKVETFGINSAQSFTPLGQTYLQLPRQEGLRTVRFDDKRAYAITYNQTDPLFTIDLENPAAPRVRGELHMPGFMFYLEPYGDRLIGLGVDANDVNGSLNVSLFDVQNLDSPQLISRVPFGQTQVPSNYTIVNFELPEDQDRIQKAFQVFADGIVAVPFNYAYSTNYRGGDSCSSVQGAVQLIDWTGDKLKPHSRLLMRGGPRRAFENNGEMIAVSDSNVSAFSLAPGFNAPMTANLEIGPCTLNYGPDYGYFEDDYFACSAAAIHRAAPIGAGSGVLLGALFGMLLLARTARTARRRAE